MFFFIFLYRDHFAEGNRLQNLNRHEEALAAYDMAIKLNPTYSEAYYNRGECLRGLYRFEEAVVSFDMAIKHNPTNSFAYNSRRNYLTNLNRLDEALVSNRMPVTYNPNYISNIYVKRGLCYYRDYDALCNYRIALFYNPHNSEAKANSRDQD